MHLSLVFVWVFFLIFLYLFHLNFIFGRLHVPCGDADVAWEIGRKEAVSNSLGLQLLLALY